MSLDSETLAFLKVVFQEACNLLPLNQRTHEMRSAMAVRILKCAAQGERNPTKLRMLALAAINETQSSTSAIPIRRHAHSLRDTAGPQ